MRFKHDRRSAFEQAKSGLKIAGALLVSLGTIVLFGIGYRLLVNPGRGDIVAGWMLLVLITALLLTTMRFWRLWFPGIPSYVGLRSSWGFFFGWFMPDASWLWVIVFPLLMFAMVFLSLPFSKKSYRMSGTDRAVLLVSLLCLLVAITNLLLFGLVKSAVILSAVGDGVLLLSWLSRKQLRGVRGTA